MSPLRELGIYWQLIRALLLPLRWLRWSMLGALAIGLIGAGLWWWSERTGLVLLLITLVYSLLILGVGGMLLPGQMLALVSSKQLTLLGDLRPRLWFLLLGFALVTSVFYSGLAILVKNQFAPGAAFLAVFTVVSFILSLVLVTGAYWPGLQGVVYAFTWFYMQAGGWLMLQNPLWLAAASILCWLLVYAWWMRWRPERHLKNFMTQSQSAWWNGGNSDSPEWLKRLNWQPKGGAASWLGSSLRGQADGLLAELQRAAMGLGVGLMFASLGIWAMGLSDWLKIWQALGPMMLLMLILGVSIGLAFTMCRRIPGLWLFFPGDRRALLRYMHRSYWRQLLPWAVLMLLIIVVLDMLAGSARAWTVPLVVLLLALAIGAQLFYVSLFIYRLSGASKRWQDWLLGLLFLAWVIAIAVQGFFIVQDDTNYLRLVPLVVAALLINLVLAMLLPRLWSNVSLLRSQ